MSSVFARSWIVEGTLPGFAAVYLVIERSEKQLISFVSNVMRDFQSLITPAVVLAFSIADFGGEPKSNVNLEVRSLTSQNDA